MFNKTNNILHQEFKKSSIISFFSKSAVNPFPRNLHFIYMEARLKRCFFFFF